MTDSCGGSSTLAGATYLYLPVCKLATVIFAMNVLEAGCLLTVFMEEWY